MIVRKINWVLTAVLLSWSTASMSVSSLLQAKYRVCYQTVSITVIV